MLHIAAHLYFKAFQGSKSTKFGKIDQALISYQMGLLICSKSVIAFATGISAYCSIMLHTALSCCTLLPYAASHCSTANNLELVMVFITFETSICCGQMSQKYVGYFQRVSVLIDT